MKTARDLHIDYIERGTQIHDLQAENLRLKAKLDASMTDKDKQIEHLETLNTAFSNELNTFMELNEELARQIESDRNYIDSLVISHEETCFENQRLKEALQSIMTYTRLGVGSVRRIRQVAGKALAAQPQKGQGNE